MFATTLAPTLTAPHPNPALSLIPTLDRSSLLTDLYQLTMAACYCGEGLDQRPARFELFARKLPKNFGYLIAMGLSQVLDYLEHFQFTTDQITALQNTGLFQHVPDRFWDVLGTGHFSGDIWAVPEGTVIFANEPILRVDAPLWQAQIVETYLLNVINYQTLIATRAARIRDVAGEQAILLEFGTRRAFSPQASLWAARAALAGGFDATSNVLAALELGQTPSGTMAHALVMALTALAGSEDQAFTAFHRYFPDAALLIDTYDTVAAADRLAQKVAAGAPPVQGVRLDSGDLVSLSQSVIDRLPEAQVFASGDLDEFEIERLRRDGAMIHGYGLGTKLVSGNPVNGVYKLVDMDGIPVMKEAEGKITYPGCKQVFRQMGPEGVRDRLGLQTEIPGPGEIPLLQLMMKAGQRVQPPSVVPSNSAPPGIAPGAAAQPGLSQAVHSRCPATQLAAIAQYTRSQVVQLPAALRRITNPDPNPVTLSADLEALTAATRKHSASCR